MTSRNSIEDLARAGEEFVGNYVSEVVAATDTLLDRLLGNVATLVSAVIEDGISVVRTAVDAILPETGRE